MLLLLLLQEGIETKLSSDPMRELSAPTPRSEPPRTCQGHSEQPDLMSVDLTAPHRLNVPTALSPPQQFIGCYVQPEHTTAGFRVLPDVLPGFVAIVRKKIIIATLLPVIRNAVAEASACSQHLAMIRRTTAAADVQWVRAGVSMLATDRQSSHRN